MNMIKNFAVVLIVSIWLMPASFALAEEAPALVKPEEGQAAVSPSPAPTKPAFCPATEPAAGPSEGQDYQAEIARAFMQEIRNSGFRDPGDTTGYIGSSPFNQILGRIDGLGPTAFPGGKDAYVSFRSCHGSTRCYPAEKKHHGAYRNRPDGDAVDITPRDGYGLAVFNGTASSGGSGRNSYTVVTSTNGRLKAYYYHTNNVKQGRVQAGERIVRTGAGGIHHIHFELLADGKSVHGDTSTRKNGEREYVRSLWFNMKKVLGL